MHQKQIIAGGKKIADAERALILLHGRGASAAGIMGLASSLSVQDYALIAPQATDATWYPYSFLAAPSQNEPWLSSALATIGEIVDDINAAGIRSENIFFAGFSQGACLTLEYVARNARRWGGVAAFTGGLIGDRIYKERYAGDFGGTPIFLGSADPDPHVPTQRVRESTALLQSMNASVLEKILPGIGHTITDEEIVIANEWVFGRQTAYHKE